MTDKIDPRWLELVNKELPCNYHTDCSLIRDEHSPYCPAHYRPAVAKALQEADTTGRLDELKDLVILLASPDFTVEQRRQYISKRCSELRAAGAKEQP